MKRQPIYKENGIIIPLTQNQFTIIDFEDEEQCQFNWFAWFNPTTKSFYARRGIENIKLHLHREIIRPLDEFEIDHISHDSLDNRRSNLRVVTSTQNKMNKRKYSNNTSGVIGVCWHKSHQKWTAQIRVNKILIYLGIFTTFEDATQARQTAELKYFGEYRYVNNTK